MASIKEIQLKNTMKFLESYTEKMVDLTKIEIGRKRRRVYNERTINSPIDATGKGRESVSYSKQKKGFYIEGNDYLEDVDEGAETTDATPESIYQWIKDKPVRIRNAKGRLLTMTEYRRRNLANLIVDKLNAKGIKPTYFLTDLVKESTDKLNGIEDDFVEDVIEGIEDLLEHFGFIEKGDVMKLKKEI